MTDETFKDMTIKQKISWFFQYYGMSLVVTVVVLAAMGILVKSIFFPGDIEDAVVLIYSDAVTTEEATKLAEEIEADTGKTVSIQVISISDPYGSQALAAKVGCDVLDVVVAPEKEMMIMSENQFLLSYAPVEGSDMYMGIPRSAREGDLLEIVIDYLNQVL